MDTQDVNQLTNKEKAELTMKLLNERKKKRQIAKEKFADTLQIESIRRSQFQKKSRII